MLGSPESARSFTQKEAGASLSSVKRARSGGRWERRDGTTGGASVSVRDSTERKKRLPQQQNRTGLVVRGDAIIGAETLLMPDIVVMSRAVEKSARAILSGTARVIGDEAERHSSTRQPHRQECPHQRQRTSSTRRRKPAAHFGDRASDARTALQPNPCGKKLTGDGNVEQPAENAAERCKPPGHSVFFHAKPGGSRRSATWTMEPA